MPAFFLGVFAVVVGNRIACSAEAFREVTGAAPAPATQRTLALCLAGLVPAGVAAVWLVVLLGSRAAVPSRPVARGSAPSLRYLPYQVGLCGLAVLGAMLATPRRERHLLRAFWTVAALAAICLVLAMTTGQPAPVEFGIR